MLYNVMNADFNLHRHFSGTPKEWDGMSVVALLVPLIFRVVNRDSFVIWRWRASAQMSCVAAGEFLTARHCTQFTLGLLSLYKVMCFPFRCTPITVSMARNKKTRAVSSRSEFVSVLWVFVDEIMFALMSLCQGK